jgi:putative transposase
VRSGAASRGAPRRRIRWRCGGPTSSSATSAPPGPNQLWVADLSYLRCWEGLVYFAFVIDAYSRMIVGWQLAMHMRTDLVLDALKMALGLRGAGADVELVHHSDRGSAVHVDRLHPDPRRPRRARLGRPRRRRLRQRARRVVRRQLQDRTDADRVWRSRSQLELATVEYLGWFNNARLHESLGDIPPVEYEQHHADRLAVAASLRSPYWARSTRRRHGT